MFAEPEFWVAVAFFILMAVFAYFGIHRTVLTTLDHRSERIKAELDDARRLKEEAAKVLAEYKARHASAEREADGDSVICGYPFQTSFAGGGWSSGNFRRDSPANLRILVIVKQRLR